MPPADLLAAASDGHHAPDLVPTLVGGLTAALVLGYVTHRLGLSPIVGYLLAGIAASANTPGPSADSGVAEELAKVGIVLLMFGVGLHFHFGELLAVRWVAVPGAILQGLATTGLGFAVGVTFGWDWQASLVFGLSLSVASTVVLTRVLSDRNDLHTPVGHAAVGWLVVQDLIAVFYLVLLPAVVGKGAGGLSALPAVLGLAAVKVCLAVAAVFLVGGRFIPAVFRRAAATGSRELFTLTVLVVALGIAFGSARLFGVSMELGAFLAGMVVGRSDFSVRAATEALPMRDAFAVLFFVSVGMLFDPRSLLAAPALMAATVAVVLVGTPVAALAVVLALGRTARLAVPLAFSLAQIGEFSFLIATLGREAGVLGQEATHALVAASLVTISLNPLIYRLADPIAARLTPFFPGRGQATDTATPDGDRPDPRYRAVVIGYGPVGRTVVRLLRENDIEPTVVELNLTTVDELRADGVRAVYGDAAHRETLEQAGVDRAATLILSASGLPTSPEVIRLARELNPRVRVLARTAYLRERAALKAAGADGVFAGEGEVALAMTGSLLEALGATPEQIDRERERLRDDLLGGSEPTHPIERPPTG